MNTNRKPTRKVTVARNLHGEEKWGANCKGCNIATSLAGTCTGTCV